MRVSSQENGGGALTPRKLLAQIRSTIGEEPVVFWKDTWDCWRSEAILRGSVEEMASHMNYNVWWVRQISEATGAFVLPPFVRKLCIDFTSKNWEVAVFSPKDYDWDLIQAFLLSHFRRFVDGEVREFTIVELKEMIVKTYPDRGANACFDMAANLVDDFSNREDVISFSDMLKCYRASLEDSDAREHVFSEMKILGFDDSEMRLPNISDAMFGCLQQLEQLGDQVDNDPANRMPTNTEELFQQLNISSKQIDIEQTGI